MWRQRHRLQRESPACVLLPESILHGSRFGPKIQSCPQAWPTVPDEPPLSLWPWRCVGEQRSCWGNKCQLRLWMTWVSWHLAENCGTRSQNSTESGNPPSSTSLRCPPRERKKYRCLSKERAREKLETRTGCWDRGSGGKNGLCQYWYHELQHCLHTSPPLPAGAFLWMTFPSPKTVSECRNISKGLNHALWTNWQEGEDLSANMWKQGEGERAAALMGWAQPLQVS